MLETVGFFIVPVACLDELRELHEYKRLAEDTWDIFVRENQYFLRARKIASHHIELVVDKDSFSPLDDILDELDYRAWRDDPGRIFTPEQCAARLRAMDVFEDHRGGRDRIIRYLVRDGIRRAEAATRAVYMLLRAVLERAHREGAGLTWASLYPEAEEKAEAERRHKQEVEADLARLEREGKLDQLIPMVEWDFDLGEEIEKPDLSDMDEAGVNRLIDQTLWQVAVERTSPERKQPDPEIRPYEYPELVVVPERFVTQVQTMRREADELWNEARELTRSLAKGQEANNLMAREAHDDTKFQLLGERGAWDVICVEALGLEPRLVSRKDHGVQSMLFPAAEARAMADALQRWIESLGGRDAAIAYIAERAVGRSHAMSERVYDEATRLFYMARERGAAFAIIQSFRA